MKKSIVLLTIVLLCMITGTVAIGVFYSMDTPSQIESGSTIMPSQTSQPTVIPTATQPIVEPTVAPTPRIVYKYSTLNVLSPINNAIYTTTTIELTFTVTSKVLWSYYSIDASETVDIQHLLSNNGWIPFNGNVTLFLSEGSHRLRVAVQTEESRHSSSPIAYQTIDFTINPVSG
jgi:hypothetical protein